METIVYDACKCSHVERIAGWFGAARSSNLWTIRTRNKRHPSNNRDRFLRSLEGAASVRGRCLRLLKRDGSFYLKTAVIVQNSCNSTKQL
jgi:hypothetical protein